MRRERLLDLLEKALDILEDDDDCSSDIPLAPLCSSLRQ